MLRLFLAGEHLNQLLARFTDLQVTYQHGVLVGHFKLPIGGATAVAVPAQRGRQLVISVPFKQIKGDITGGFLLSRLTKAFWGHISDTIRRQSAGPLREMGLPPDTVGVGREQSHDGEVGLVTVSLDRVNQWLATQPIPGLVPLVEAVEFQAEGLALAVQLLARRN